MANVKGVVRVVCNQSNAVGCFKLSRNDNHELSLSSMSHGLVHFDAKGEMVKDYGWVSDAAKFQVILSEFLSVPPAISPIDPKHLDAVIAGTVPADETEAYLTV